eukprot:CAMPEP_0169278556 /NCGR_PEP_ID=MMETSP1016-20121227/54396_1 /TAXON_ID=342587 /ORGANISM="Karlodinium micrum, Strain CCMP2283" /LENGTH=56 /DNA_ID=CAMNT_0009366341 /DNA_START=388 /DNA_END=554 /DNA_ORIENTATION=-
MLFGLRLGEKDVSRIDETGDVLPSSLLVKWDISPLCPKIADFTRRNCCIRQASNQA